MASRSHMTSPSHDSALPRALDFTESSHNVLRKEAYFIDLIDPEDVKTEVKKYHPDPADLPRGQMNQLQYLLTQFKTNDLRMAFIKLITTVGGGAPKAFDTIPTTKAGIMKDLLCLIYDHKSMMIDTDVNSYR